LIQNYFLVLWFSSKRLSNDEEAWQTASFLCIVIAHEEEGLMGDKTPRSSSGKDKRDVFKGSFSGEKETQKVGQ